MRDDCTCGHGPLDHRRIDLAETLVARWMDPADPPTHEVRVMRSECRRWRCWCLLYIERSLVTTEEKP